MSQASAIAPNIMERCDTDFGQLGTVNLPLKALFPGKILNCCVTLFFSIKGFLANIAIEMLTCCPEHGRVNPLMHENLRFQSIF